jgi:hypothetical protein
MTRLNDRPAIDSSIDENSLGFLIAAYPLPVLETIYQGFTERRLNSIHSIKAIQDLKNIERLLRENAGITTLGIMESYLPLLTAINKAIADYVSVCQKSMISSSFSQVSCAIEYQALLNVYIEHPKAIGLATLKEMSTYLREHPQDTAIQKLIDEKKEEMQIYRDEGRMIHAHGGLLNGRSSFGFFICSLMMLAFRAILSPSKNYNWHSAGLDLLSLMVIIFGGMVVDGITNDVDAREIIRFPKLNPSEFNSLGRTFTQEGLQTWFESYKGSIGALEFSQHARKKLLISAALVTMLFVYQVLQMPKLAPASAALALNALCFIAGAYRDLGGDRFSRYVNRYELAGLEQPASPV